MSLLNIVDILDPEFPNDLNLNRRLADLLMQMKLYYADPNESNRTQYIVSEDSIYPQLAASDKQLYVSFKQKFNIDAGTMDFTPGTGEQKQPKQPIVREKPKINPIITELLHRLDAMLIRHTDKDIEDYAQYEAVAITSLSADERRYYFLQKSEYVSLGLQLERHRDAPEKTNNYIVPLLLVVLAASVYKLMR